MKKLTILLFLALFSFTNAQETVARPYDVVLMESVSKYCSEHSTEFSKWEKAYLKHVIAGKGKTYPQSGSIYSPSNRTQEKANQIAYYAAVREAQGDTLYQVTDNYIIFKTGKPKTPAAK